MHWIFVLATQRKKEASQRFSNLALISVTWQQSTLCVERWLPQCAQKRRRLSSPELFLSFSPSPPTICLSALFINVQILFLIDLENAEFWRLEVSVPTCTQKKNNEKSVCVCTRTHVCIYQKIFQRRKLCPYKFITAAKLTGSSVKDQLWGEKLHNTIKHLLQNTMSNVFDCDSPGSLAFLTCCTFIEVVSCVVVAQI